MKYIIHQKRVRIKSVLKPLSVTTVSSPGLHVTTSCSEDINKSLCNKKLLPEGCHEVQGASASELRRRWGRRITVASKLRGNRLFWDSSGNPTGPSTSGNPPTTAGSGNPTGLSTSGNPSATAGSGDPTDPSTSGSPPTTTGSGNPTGPSASVNPPTTAGCGNPTTPPQLSGPPTTIPPTQASILSTTTQSPKTAKVATTIQQTANPTIKPKPQSTTAANPTTTAEPPTTKVATLVPTTSAAPSCDFSQFGSTHTMIRPSFLQRTITIERRSPKGMKPEEPLVLSPPELTSGSLSGMMSWRKWPRPGQNSAQVTTMEAATGRYVLEAMLLDRIFIIVGDSTVVEKIAIDAW
ncbi:protein SPT2 homolog [Palaemon carinicauda]|uniref:protein SPT2 homolog n=1 Tax=Palaemon carinicauda TaxID=392227 RepID=UPI0035B6155F